MDFRRHPAGTVAAAPIVTSALVLWRAQMVSHSGASPARRASGARRHPVHFFQVLQNRYRLIFITSAAVEHFVVPEKPDCLFAPLLLFLLAASRTLMRCQRIDATGDNLSCIRRVHVVNENVLAEFFQPLVHRDSLSSISATGRAGRSSADYFPIRLRISFSRSPATVRRPTMPYHSV